MNMCVSLYFYALTVSTVFKPCLLYFFSCGSTLFEGSLALQCTNRPRM